MKWFVASLVFLYFNLALLIGLFYGLTYNLVDDYLLDIQRQRLKLLCEKEYKLSLKFDYCCKSCWHTWLSPHHVYTCPKCRSKNIDMDYYKTDD